MTSSPVPTSLSRSRRPGPSSRLYESSTLRAGTFEIGPDDPEFPVAGQVAQAEFVFPRTAVWIEPNAGAPFAADPSLVTLYNGGEPYRRRRLGESGDRCDWFAFAPSTLLEVVASVDPAARERPERPFAQPFAPIDGRGWLAERRVVARLRSGEFDPLWVEETMLEVFRGLVEAASRSRRTAPVPRGGRSSRRFAGDVKAFALSRLGERLTLDRLARAVGTTPFHLSRRFRAETGETLHAWLLSVRLRFALERVAEPRSDLAAVALDAGFSNHSHFSSAFRAAFGMPPSVYRRRASGGAVGRASRVRTRSGAQ